MEYALEEARFVICLARTLTSDEFNLPKDMVILVGYKDQKKLLKRILMSVLEKYNQHRTDADRSLSMADLPEIVSIDGSQDTGQRAVI